MLNIRWAQGLCHTKCAYVPTETRRTLGKMAVLLLGLQPLQPLGFFIEVVAVALNGFNGLSLCVSDLCCGSVEYLSIRTCFPKILLVWKPKLESKLESKLAIRMRQETLSSVVFSDWLFSTERGFAAPGSCFTCKTPFRRRFHGGGSSIVWGSYLDCKAVSYIIFKTLVLVMYVVCGYICLVCCFWLAFVLTCRDYMSFCLRFVFQPCYTSCIFVREVDI